MLFLMPTKTRARYTVIPNGPYIREIREKLKLTQAEFGAALGHDQSWASHTEGGQPRARSHMIGLALYCGVPFEKVVIQPPKVTEIEPPEDIAV